MGSEMCIRDSFRAARFLFLPICHGRKGQRGLFVAGGIADVCSRPCQCNLLAESAAGRIELDGDEL